MKKRLLKLFIISIMSFFIGTFACTAYAIEYAIFPADVMQITQGVYDGAYSHASTNAIDLVGTNNFYAPFSGTITYIWEECNGVVLQSDSEVKYANGTTGYMSVMFMHDNDISDLWVGKHINQGEIFYQPGIKGWATGTHLHLCVRSGKDKFLNDYDNGNVLPYDAFYIKKSTNIINSYGYNWRYLDDPAPSGGWITADKTSIRKGETVTFNFGINNVVHSGVGIDKNGSRYHTIEATGKSSASYTFNEVGTYNVVYEGYNSAGTMGYSNWLTITVSENTYTITYNANGGSGAPSAQTKTHNTTLALSTTKPTRTGYTFLGWSTSSSASTATYQPGGSFTSNANTTLYAVWRINTYTITYNLNGGTGEIKAQTKTHGTAVTLSDKVPTREGHTFLGWAKSSSATSAQYSPSASFAENADTTLFAVWKINTFTVTFDANGGQNPPEPQTKVYGIALTLTKTRPVRANYSFEGWNTKADGTGTTYAAGGSYTANSEVTLYAMWDPNAVSITLDPNGGVWYNSAEMQILWNKYDRTEELEMPKREGFELAGFTLDSTSDAVVYPYGKPLFTDTKFENGMNGMRPYNNLGSDTMLVEKVAASSDCPTKSDYMIKIQTIGEKSRPSYGGFVQEVYSKANGVFYQVIVAKIPKGYNIEHAANPIGDYAQTQWITSNKGTGEWETYILRRHFGMTGTFSTFGFVFISDSYRGRYTDEIDNPTDNPLTWYVAYANIFDATDLDNRTNDAWFAGSYNNILTYNNSRNETVKIERVLYDEDTAKYALKITTDGMASPQYGGYIQSTSAKPNHVYYHYIRAIVPEGYSLNYAHNLGNNAKFTWISSQNGNGNWKDYLYMVECNENVSTNQWGFGHIFE